ncbi:MAG: YfhO family protein, partial [Allobaculum sp.]|nr:YfhO family protein [Allobaculum sp.]
VITNTTHIQGSYSATEAETMVFTVPYDKGWSASVNGQPVTIQNWNEAFLAIDLSPGENAIELVYKPSGLNLGLILSGIGLVCALILLVGPWAYRRYVKPTSLKKSQSKAESKLKAQSSTSTKTATSTQAPRAQAIKQRQEAAQQKEASQANTPPQAEALKKRQATRLKEETSKNTLELTETKTGLARFNPFNRKKKETAIVPTPSKPQAEALVQREKRRQEAARAAQAQKEQALKTQTALEPTPSKESSNAQERHQMLVEEAKKIANQSHQEDTLEQVEQSAKQAMRFENQEVAQETETTSNSLPKPLEAQEADEKLEQEGLKTFTLQGIVLPEIIQGQDDSSLDVPTLSNGLQSQQDSSSEKESQKTDHPLQKNQTNEPSSRLVSSDLDLSNTEDVPLHQQALEIAQRLQAGSQKQALDMWEKWIGKKTTIEENSIPTQPFRTNLKEKGSEKTSENPTEEIEQSTVEIKRVFGPYGLKPSVNETNSLKNQDSELESQSDLVIEDKTIEQVEEVDRDEFLFSDQEEQQLAEHLAADFLQRLRRQAKGQKTQEDLQDSNSKNG